MSPLLPPPPPPSPAVVEECKRRLVSRGFSELKEKHSWKIEPLGKVSMQSVLVFAS